MLTLRDRKSAAFSDVKSMARATPAFSPDGRWVAYAVADNEVAGTQVFVQPFPPTGARYQLFARAGDFPHHPLWTPDGKQLLYVPRVGDLEAVTVEAQPRSFSARRYRSRGRSRRPRLPRPGRLTSPPMGRSSGLLFRHRIRRRACRSDPFRSF
jgi:WD40-like Beta Propeller Repeat